MKKLLQIAFYIGILFTGTVFAGTPQNTYHLIALKKASGTEITAAAIYSNGLSAYFGDSDGHIFSVNRFGVTKYNTNPATGTVDSIVETSGGNGLGNFTFTADGRVYTHDVKNNTNTELDLPTDNNARLTLRYDLNAGLFCTAASDNTNSISRIYHYSGNEHWNEVKANNNNSPACTSKQSSLTYSINDAKNSSNNTEDESSNLQQKNTIYNDYGRFTWTSDGEIEGCFAPDLKDSNTNPVTVTFVSRIYDFSTTPATPTNDAIYRITIHGVGIGQDDGSNYLFGKGYGFNGISYDVSCPADSKYTKTEYPILGYQYIEDGIGKSSTLNPRNISFLWRGPLSTSTNQYKVKVLEHVYDFSLNNEVPVSNDIWSSRDGVIRNLQTGSQPTVNTNYSIELDDPSSSTPTSISRISCYPTGVSLTPVIVRIKNGNTYLPSTDDSYNHLVFYVNSSAGTQMGSEDGIIGCDLYDSKTNYISVIPQNVVDSDGSILENAEIDGLVKYGNAAPHIDNGRVFYITMGPHFNIQTSTSPSVDIGVALVGEKTIDQNSSEPYQINAPLEIDANSTGIEADPSNNYLNSPYGVRYFNLIDNGSRKEIEVSSWEGKADGTDAGYLDYVAPKETVSPKDDAPAGVFAVFPQGLNDLSLFPDRINPAAMHAGYYFQPQDNLDGLHANRYGINDKTSYCSILRNQTVYAYLFDQYGRYATYSTKDNDPIAGRWKLEIHKNGYSHIRLTNWSNVPVCMHGDEIYKEEFHNSLGVSAYAKGVFMPPEAEDDPGVSFITNCPSKVSSDHEKNLYMYASLVCHATGGDPVDYIKTPADPHLYDYFWTKLIYHNTYSSFHVWSDIGFPDSIKSDSIQYVDKYLPLNQIEYYLGNSDPRLIYWGVHFIPWNMSCYGAEHDSRHGDDGYAAGFTWGFGQTWSLYHYYPSDDNPAYVKHSNQKYDSKDKNNKNVESLVLHKN